MKVRFYGRLAEILGKEIEVQEAGTQTIAGLRATLAALHPEASVDLRGRTTACMNDVIVNDQSSIGEADIVEFFPPLSGG